MKTLVLASVAVFHFGLLQQSVHASSVVPDSLRGDWTDNQETCATLRKNGPTFLRSDQRWLRVFPTHVVGSLVGLYIGRDKKDPNASVLIQSMGENGSIVDLMLSTDGRLYETIAGARASAKYARCR